MTISTNKFTKIDFTRNSISGWIGDNITSGAAGFDDIYSGIAPGDFESGGIEHFRGRTETEVNHW